jgi:hypothetical protein
MSHQDIPSAHDSAVRRLCQTVVPLWVRHLETAQQQADQGVGALLSQFSRLRQLLLQMPDSPDITTAKTVMDDILTSFQYHDRVAQMSQLLRDDIAALGQSLDSDTAAQSLDPQAWLARMEAGYAMEEQRLNHGANASPGGPLSPPDSETTYF